MKTFRFTLLWLLLLKGLNNLDVIIVLLIFAFELTYNIIYNEKEQNHQYIFPFCRCT